MGETVRVRQPGGAITLRLPERTLTVEVDGREGEYEVCCLDKAVATLRRERRRREAMADG